MRASFELKNYVERFQTETSWALQWAVDERNCCPTTIGVALRWRTDKTDAELFIIQKKFLKKKPVGSLYERTPSKYLTMSLPSGGTKIIKRSNLVRETFR